jgi:hypothetical protein
MSREPVTHIVDEDWDALCHRGKDGDQMWAFMDERITCPDCRRVYADES